jgi:hypothetical protein
VAIESYAKAAGYIIVDRFYDAAGLALRNWLKNPPAV